MFVVQVSYVGNDIKKAFGFFLYISERCFIHLDS